MSLSIAGRKSNLHFAEYLNLQGKAKKSVRVVSSLRGHVSLSCYIKRKRAKVNFSTGSCVF